MLVYLRGELHEITVNVGAALAAQAGAAEHPVEAMAEFMEHGLNLVEGEQSGGVGGRTGEISHIIYNRTSDGAVGIHV